MFPLISVIIPVYNTEKYIVRCLDSIVQNTYSALEILCINDGSTDNSGALLHDYAQKDSRIRVIDKENGGVSSARNKGIEVATGAFVAFIDADDWVHPQYFECLMAVQSKTDADILSCGYCRTETFQMGDRFSIPNVAHTVFRNTLPANHIRYIGGLVYRTDIIRQYRFPTDIRIAEDLFFNTVLITNELDCGHCVCFAAVDRALYYYFRNAESALRSTTSHAFGQLESAERYLTLATNAKTEPAKAVFAERACKAAFLYRYLKMFEADAAEAHKAAAEVCRPSIQILRALPSVCKRDKILYTLFAAVPMLYRLSRIAADRTLLIWEINQRKQRASRRRQAR